MPQPLFEYCNPGTITYPKVGNIASHSLDNDFCLLFVVLQLGDQSRVLEDIKNGLGTTQSQLKDTQKQVLDIQSLPKVFKTPINLCIISHKNYFFLYHDLNLLPP